MKHIKSFNQLNEELDISTRKSAFGKMAAIADDRDHPESSVRGKQARNIRDNLSGPSEGLMKKLKEYLLNKKNIRAQIWPQNLSLLGKPEYYYVWLRINLVPTNVVLAHPLDMLKKSGSFDLYIEKDKYTVNNLEGDILDRALGDRGFINKLKILVKSIQENDVYTPTTTTSTKNEVDDMAELKKKTAQREADPSTWSQSHLNDEIDQALDKSDLDRVKELSKYLKESKVYLQELERIK